MALARGPSFDEYQGLPFPRAQDLPYHAATGGRHMNNAEMAYLWLVLGAFGIFALVLIWQSSRGH